ncbi:hypothetical protein GCM10009654_06350 [Streptomyces hebeiensis]|uniref:Uncharacterized protein n=1 Tax=Streptomyces hebeiensis TaxID=229486 RepID=A0ABN1UIY0_9ACTN
MRPARAPHLPRAGPRPRVRLRLFDSCNIRKVESIPLNTETAPGRSNPCPNARTSYASTHAHTYARGGRRARVGRRTRTRVHVRTGADTRTRTRTGAHSRAP